MPSVSLPLVDLACAALLACLAAAALATAAVMTRAHRDAPVRARLLAPVQATARRLIAAGVTANAITAASLAVAAAAALLIALGHFGAAALALAIASVGDALDGAVARGSGAASTSGALFDASADRYEELAFLGGLALEVHARVPALALTWLAMGGSFLVSYGSAKAEAARIPVPGGPMRRAARATWLIAGAALTVPWDAAAARLGSPSWAAHAPMLVAVAAIAIVGNASAVRRLRTIARAAADRAVPRGAEWTTATTTATTTRRAAAPACEAIVTERAPGVARAIAPARPGDRGAARGDGAPAREAQAEPAE